MNIEIVMSTPVAMVETGLHKKFLPLTLPEEKVLQDGSLLHPQMKHRFWDCVKDKTGKTFLAYADGEPCAWALTFPRWSDTHFFIYVDKQFRRQGIGNKLLESAKVFYEQPLVVSPWNPDSKGFYDQTTFTETYPYVLWASDVNL